MLEVLNHIHCVDYILDHVMEPLTQKYIRQIHSLLMGGTVDERQGRVRSGEYRTVTSRGRDRALLPAGQINSSLTELLKYYESRATRS